MRITEKTQKVLFLLYFFQVHFEITECGQIKFNEARIRLKKVAIYREIVCKNSLFKFHPGSIPKNTAMMKTFNRLGWTVFSLNKIVTSFFFNIKPWIFHFVIFQEDKGGISQNWLADLKLKIKDSAFERVWTHLEKGKDEFSGYGLKTIKMNR